MRFLVMDTGDDFDAVEAGGHRGTLLGEFNTEASAQTLALQQLAYGDRTVMVVDRESGSVVFPPEDESHPSSMRRASGLHSRPNRGTAIELAAGGNATRARRLASG